MNKILILLLIGFQSIAQNPRRLEILFLGDSLSHHRPIERVPEIMAALGPKGINFTYTDKMEDVNLPYLRKFDAVLLYANIDEISPEAERAFLTYVAEGHGFLPIHCASYCFRNSEQMVQLMGGQFWRHTMDSISTENIYPSHPVMKGQKPFTVYDETYLHRYLQEDNVVLARRKIKEDQKKDKPNEEYEPYTWVRTYGYGKVFYTALGHDQRTWTNEGFQNLLYNAILWVVPEEAQKAFLARNPESFKYKEAKLPNYEQRPGPQLQQYPLSPEESMKHLQVPVDFDISLFASEPNVMHPIALSWDEKGRLYVLITKDYPNERKEEGGSDYILRCEDTDGDGKADTFVKFADGLSIPTGMVHANGGIIVSQAPDMLFLKDTDGDGIADHKEVLFTGFGTFDTHAGPSNLQYGFDNWIWGCVGYSGFNGKTEESDSLRFGQAFFRFTPDGKKLEWMTTTSNNTWGMAFNETNDVFGSTANNSHGWYMAIPHSFLQAPQVVDNGSRSTDTHRDMKPITSKVRQVDAFGGFTAAAGHNFYTARSFPKEYWNQIAFVCEPTGHIVHENQMLKKGTDFSDKEHFNLVAGADEWFSPVFAQTGPDGAVWIADWYSFIIQHNPTPKGFENGSGNAYETDLRDYTHGRIYRVAYKNAPEYQPVSLSKEDPQGLLNALESDNLFWRMHAQRLLVERGNTDVVPSLASLVRRDKNDVIGVNGAAINALWTLHGLNALETEVQLAALKHPNAHVRKNALKTLPFSASSAQAILDLKLLDDPEPLVVLNALLVLSKSPLSPEVEAYFVQKLKENKGVEDRWLPDAFATVISANQGELLKKLVTTEPVLLDSEMDHSMHAMSKTEDNSTIDGLDLIISEIEHSPVSPAARERISIAVHVKNRGNVDLPKDVLIPFSLRFSGEGLQVDQWSNNFKDGLKAGETTVITKNLNGPWVGNLSFYTDKPGNYTISASLDPQNTIKESVENNNSFQKKIAFKAPQDLAAFAMEKSIRSLSHSANPADLVALMKSNTRLPKEALYKAMAGGWNYKRSVESLPKSLRKYLLDQSYDENLDKLLVAWNVKEKPTADPNRKVVLIKTVREAMKFATTEFTVAPGQSVEIVLENTDAMQHNLVVVGIGQLEKVGLAADKMLMDAKGVEKNYVPNMPEVLAATPLVNADQSYRLVFEAPTQAGDYPFVCTFPGHWRLMNGIMKVRP